MIETKNIRHALRPFHLVNLIVGLGYYDFQRSNYAKNWVQFVYTATFLNCFIVMVWYATSSLNDYLFKLFAPYQGLFWLIFYSNIMLMTTLIIASSFKVKKLQAAIELVETCDQKMEDMGLPKQYRLVYKSQIKMFVILTITILINVTATYWWQFSIMTSVVTKLYVAASITLPVLLIGVSIFSFLFWVRYTRMKFCQLNGLLRGMMTTTPDSPMHKRVMKLINELDKKKFKNETIHTINGNANMMRAAKQIHLELVKISRTMNNIYGIQILVIMFSSLLLVTCLLYVSYKIVWLTLTTPQYVQEIGPLVSWLLLYVLNIFFTNNECIKTSAEAADTGDLICELYKPSTTKEFRAEIRHFTLQMIQNPVVFTACGFFNIDQTFIQGVVGTITTYLVILIQMGDIKPSNSTNTTTVTAFTADSNVTMTSITTA
ncbi:putative gustatory receptor 28b [Hylaeus anthracinus]|uniref:putative gustatory receptor 28b n=1 Tax=Hylaeus anthracinus TaxID=313031 RepID=UPI0023B9566D|nr:putative gustatory receptor 28b [Hylaeus anthracinus]